MAHRKLRSQSLAILFVSACVASATAQEIYWVSRGSPTLVRADPVAGDAETFDVPDLQSTVGVAVDEIAGKLLFVDTAGKRIRRSNLDGTEPETLLAGLGEPIAIAVDPVGGKMYWVDAEREKIMRADLDGSTVETAFAVGPTGVEGLAIDAKARHLYWGQVRRIVRADLDTGVREDMFRGRINRPGAMGVDVVNRRIYWFETQGNKIQRGDYDGGVIDDLVTVARVRQIGVDATAGRLYWSRGRDVFVSDLDGANTLQLPNLAGSGGLAVDASTIYAVDSSPQAIQRIGPDGQPKAVVVGVPFDVAVDPVGERLYWSEQESRVIWSADLAGADLRLVVSAIDGWFGNLVADPAAGRLYFSAEIDGLRGIYRTKVDGDNVELILPDASSPIAVDPPRNSVYWAREQSIYRAHADGSDVELLLTDETGPYVYGIAIDSVLGKIYWIRNDRQTIAQANIDASSVEDIVSESSTIRRISFDSTRRRLYWTVNIANANHGEFIKSMSVSSGLTEVEHETSFRIDDIDVASRSQCGNGACEATENSDSCPSDCRRCASTLDCADDDVRTFDQCIATLCRRTADVPYADTAGESGCGADGVIDLRDIINMLDAFQGLFDFGCDVYSLDIADATGCGRDGRVDIRDLLAVLDAFRGSPRCP